MVIFVTGSSGFIGKNLLEWLKIKPGIEVCPFDLEDSEADLERGLDKADIVFHLAGVNRPETDQGFVAGNVDLTLKISQILERTGRRIPIVYSSSVQAELDNPYGRSKHQAEEALIAYSGRAHAPVIIFRLPNVFGKWCKPDYNSAVATFCHHIARDIPITVNDPARMMSLVYIDDVARAFVDEIDHVLSMDASGTVFRQVEPVYEIELGRIADLLFSFRQSLKSLVIPDLSDGFVLSLYGTFLSYLESDRLPHDLVRRFDERGSLAEFTKSAQAGQIFLSRTKAGVTRGNHYHQRKAEKFLVLQGEAIIRLRPVLEAETLEFHIRGSDLRVVEIPPGYVHSIENIGADELVTLFWASEIFDPGRPDTFPAKVRYEKV